MNPRIRQTTRGPLRDSVEPGWELLFMKSQFQMVWCQVLIALMNEINIK